MGASEKIRLLGDEAEEYRPSWPGGIKPLCRDRFEDLESRVAEAIAKEKADMLRAIKKQILLFSLAAMAAVGLVNMGLAWYFANRTASDFASTCHEARGLVYKGSDGVIPVCLVPEPAGKPVIP